jgi:glycerol-3-phosphate dehydrogenase (NAD(P)+)
VSAFKQPTVAVIGGGSWATALVKLLSNHLPKVSWWMRNTDSVEYIRANGHQPKYLPSIAFQANQLNLSTNLRDIIREADLIVLATPAAFLHSLLEPLTAQDFHGKTVFSAIKGIVPEFNAIPARYLHKTFEIPYGNIGIICGPCHAEEVALERLSYLTIGCEDIEKAKSLAALLQCEYIVTNVSEDLFGAEFSAILKNVYALASGICDGLGYGDNFQAVLVSNAIQEIERFIDVVNPVHRDVKSSAYLGDLLVTAYSKFSRNRKFGYLLGQGHTVEAASLEIGMIAEGYYAVKSLVEINQKFKVDLPILNAVYQIIYENQPAKTVIQALTKKLS